MKIDYVPTIVLFDAQGKERLRMEAYFRPFHVAGFTIPHNSAAGFSNQTLEP